MNNQLKKLEAWLTAQNNKLPQLGSDKKRRLRAHGKEILVVAVVISLAGAWNIWHWAHSASLYGIYPSTNFLGSTYINSYSYAPGMDVWQWIGVGLMLAAAVLFGRAFLQLRRHRGKSAWHQAFYGLLVWLTYIVFAFVTGSDTGKDDLFWSLLVVLGCLYILFQVRQHRPAKSTKKA